MKFLRNAARAAVALACASFAVCASAQEQLPQIVKIVVPYSAGGATDLLARYVADRLRQNTGRTFIVENRPGASGQIGAKAVADAAPDGSTFLLHTPALATSKIFFKSPMIPAPTVFEPVSLLAEESYVLAASGKAPFKTFKEFVAHAKANPGVLNYASGGLGESYLVFETFKKENKLSMTGVDYKGASPALIALIANEVQVGYQPATIAHTNAAAGKMHMLAISGSTRHAKYPDVPTFEEVWVKNARHRWYALFAPPKTPKAIIDRMHTELAAILATPEARQKIADVSMEPKSSTPEQLRKLVLDSLEEYTQMADLIGYQPQ